MKELYSKDAFKIIGNSARLWFDDWANQALVGLVAILCSMTIVLLPAATFGVFHQARDLARGNRTGLMGFWAGFKGYFKQNLLWGFVNLFVYAFLLYVISCYFFSMTALNSGVAMGIAGAFLVILVFWSVWQFLTLSCFFLQDDPSMKLAWKNGWAIFLRLRSYSLTLGVIILAFSLISVFGFIPLMFGAEGLIAVTGVEAVRATIKPEEA